MFNYLVNNKHTLKEESLEIDLRLQYAKGNSEKDWGKPKNRREEKPEHQLKFPLSRDGRYFVNTVHRVYCITYPPSSNLRTQRDKPWFFVEKNS